jgi:hypothetical protein
VHGFEAPDGIVAVEIDAQTGQLATTSCPKIRTQMFIAGSQPVETCKLHGGGRTQVAGWEPTVRPAEVTEIPDNRRTASTTATATPRGPDGTAARSPRSIPVTPAPAAKVPEEKKGFFGRLKSMFK